MRQNQPRRIGVSFGERDKINFFGERRDEIVFVVSFLEILLFNLRNFPFHWYPTELHDLSNIDTSSYEETAAAATRPMTTVNLALRKRALMSTGNNAEQHRTQACVHVYPT